MQKYSLREDLAKTAGVFALVLIPLGVSAFGIYFYQLRAFFVA